MFLIFGYAFLVFWPREKSETIPAYICGKWTTLAPKYKDRFFELSEVSIIFGIGGNKIDVYFIKEIQKSDEKNRVLYTVSGHNLRRTKHKISFYYHHDEVPKIKLKNQENVVWTREINTNQKATIKTKQQ